jgi:hypothetical protein
MRVKVRFVRKELTLTAVVCLGAAVFTPAIPAMPAPQGPAQNAVAKPVGTVKTIAGNTITLTIDAGSEVTVLIQDATRLLRIAPGQKDLKDAAPIQLKDLQPGDRILVRGTLAADGKSVNATSVIAMKKTDIAEKQAREREEWQKHSVGGLVNGIDAAAGTITIATAASGDKKNVLIHFSKDTVLRRYAPDSTKFDEAKPALLDQIQTGDQLRARGIRSADGTELTAEEIVSGSFRSIAGTISAIDAAAGTINVMDLATKQNVIVKITTESQLRKLPLPMAQRIAARLKGTGADAPSASASASAPPAQPTATSPSGPGGTGRGGGAPDLQQAIGRMPAATLSDLQKGDAVMIVATQGTRDAGVTVITLLGGVEPILQASPKDGASTILSPWSLNSGGGEAAAP